MRKLNCLWVVMCAASVGGAAEYYVSPEGTDAGKGTKDSPWSLKKANQEVRPGDTALLFDGTYNTAIQPARSGVDGRNIIYRALHAHKPIITGLRDRKAAAIEISDRGYITVDGLRVVRVHRFIVGNKAHHATFNNCRFEHASGFGSCRFRPAGDHLSFTNNLFRDGQDTLSVSGGNYHLIEGNYFLKDTHSTLVLRGTHSTVVRYNLFVNPTQRHMECYGTMNHRFPDPQRTSTHVVIERNLFYTARSHGTFSGIQFAAVKCIIRRNIFTNLGNAMSWYAGIESSGKAPNEAMNNRSNRFFHNVVYDCGAPSHRSSGGGGILFGSGLGKKFFSDQVFVNNIFFRNRAYPRRAPWIPPATQILVGGAPDELRCFFNNIMHEQLGEAVIAHGPTKKGYSIKEYEKAFPKQAAGNVEADPLFVDAEGRDFHLKAKSSMIDAGGPLTRTRGAGEGKSLAVKDALFFSDGFGLVPPDVIRVNGTRVAISKVDYRGNQIELAKKIEWPDGAPVCLDYAGKGPDIGALERELDESPKGTDPAKWAWKAPKGSPEEKARYRAERSTQLAAARAAAAFRPLITKAIKTGSKATFTLQVGDRKRRVKILSTDGYKIKLEMDGRPSQWSWKHLEASLQLAALAQAYLKQTPETRLQIATLYAAQSDWKNVLRIVDSVGQVEGGTKDLADSLRLLAKIKPW